MDITKLLRPHIAALKPYSSARDEFSGQAEVYLDANENPYGSLDGEQWNRYPDPLQKEIKNRLAEIKGVKPEQIFLGNGSDEGIDLLIRAFCEPGKDAVLLLPPTYGMYEVSASIHNIACKKVALLPDLQPDVEAILAASQGAKILFICSPNNPSGNDIAYDTILHLVEKFPGLVVVDEAYIDFSPQKSLLSALKRYPQLVVMQTFSKAWGMAALRLGTLYASESIIQVLNKIKPPYNINAYSQQQLLKALATPERVQENVQAINQAREVLVESLRGLPYVQEIYPSSANFVLVKMQSARKIYQQLLAEGIVVRDRSQVILCSDCLRISIGTTQENQTLIQALQSMSF
ncbi:histidinol-phosphate transaminase [Cytophagales bacterium LB-30]|uniref:Histidinol-phosphate aminotransferase n=1 Tax=Shiella aurantiaca TaxID=3058365 RepID=A0ABT8F372_9BACT|nr:histidinol-phosphate transaminase [Shiella aurantiaca]MDN4164828.1 histidinol-phosphate transaminase [Shiella aurantiaca]